MARRNCLIVSFLLVSVLAISGVLFGQRVIDLDMYNLRGDMWVRGRFGERLGKAVAHGDVNGDGYMDIIMGAFRGNKVYVIFGSSNPPLNINFYTQSADITILGVGVDWAGHAVSSGDVNADGYADIIIGAYMADPAGGSNAGATYVIFGNSFPSPPYTIYLDTQADITVYGDDADDYSGYAVISGDVTGDGYDDLIIGARLADPGGRLNAGETYVIFGSSSPPSVIDMNTQSADIIVYGDDLADKSSSAVASGDVNGDGYDDLIIGAPDADPYGKSEAGETYVIFGSSSPPSVIDLNTQSADITIYGDDSNDNSGYAVYCGDINNDSCDDIIIGAPYANPSGGADAGVTYVIFGSASPPSSIDLNTQSADITVYGNDSEDYCGYAVSYGDVNGDGYNDLITGAPRANGGAIYVVLGSSFPSPPYTIDLDQVYADITVYGDGGFFGSAVAIGDVTGDGYGDLIIGAYKAHPFAGRTHMILGGGAFITAHGLDGTSWIKAFSHLGRYWGRFKAFGDANSQGEVQLAVGDVDGDGRDEIAAGHGEGGSSWVKLFEVDGSLIKAFKTFGPGNSKGEVHLAIGNFDTNPTDGEIAVAQGEGGQSWVKIFKPDGTLIRKFKAFGPANAQGEVHLAAADVENNDGIDEIIAGMGEGGSSWVKIFSYQGTFMRRFLAFSYTDNLGGEVHLAVGNFDADSSMEIAVATGYNGSNRVKLLETDGAFIRGFTPFRTSGNYNEEVHIISADVDNDGIWEIICGHGEGGSSWVKVFKADRNLIMSFKAFSGAVNKQGEVHLGKSNY